MKKIATSALLALSILGGIANAASAASGEESILSFEDFTTGCSARATGTSRPR